MCALKIFKGCVHTQTNKHLPNIRLTHKFSATFTNVLTFTPANGNLILPFGLPSTGAQTKPAMSHKSALRSGKRAVPHIRLLLCGQGRAGKTSLRRSILKEPFCKDIDSTIGVELRKAVCTIHRDDKSNKLEWRLEKNDEVQQRLLAGKLVSEEIREHAAATTTKPPPNSSQTSPQDNNIQQEAKDASQFPSSAATLVDNAEPAPPSPGEISGQLKTKMVPRTETTLSS